MVEALKLIVLSFTASAGFGILFRIVGSDILLAGLGGGLTRAVFLLAMALVPHRGAFTLIAAMFAAFYAEYLAVRKKVPSTRFLYPAIIPLIPADLLYYVMRAVLTEDSAAFVSNGRNLAWGLTGLCVGFVAASTVVFYTRQYRAAKAGR